ncbi:condensation domain-containing protein [Dactylosporangium sp. NBC_01737]|uniref:condensation domain-containing protein n=1 Tax=Dactylosporangium sp. NBC_01737 TaxID=2975959 RepID=UPI002E11ABA7|nr:condensation domain-containing protein [Dactylosporangium sp. NBC_01737]
MVDQVVVRFAGDGAGAGELSWGQQDIWQAMVRQKSWLPNGAWGPLAAGTTVDDVAEQLRYMMSRFPSARTRLRFDAEGRPTQVVSGSGEITLEIVEAGAEDPAAVAEAVRLRLQDTEYDFAADWPIRMAAVRSGGALTHLVVVMCHLVADGFGTQVLLDELGTRVTTPIPELQPLEQARWQASPSGQRQNTLALRHWDGILRAMPPRRFPDTAEKPEPRHWRGEFKSYALGPALRAVTEQTGVASAPALLAVFAVALARVTRINPVVLRPMVNNRFRPGLDRVVCMLAQYGLCQLDVAGVSFAEVLDRARRGAMTTYKHAYYHPVELDDLVRRVVRERGADLELPCYFNDRRADTGKSGGDPEPVALRGAAARSTFRWTTRQDVPFEPLIVHLDDVPDAVQAIIFMDTHVVSPADGEALLRGMEAAAVEAALDPSAPTGV